MHKPTLAQGAQHELDSLLQNAVDQRDMPLAVAMIANQDEILYQGAVGVAGDAIFRVASMTKAVTSVSVMMLVERGLRLLLHIVGRLRNLYSCSLGILVTRISRIRLLGGQRRLMGVHNAQHDNTDHQHVLEIPGYYCSVAVRHAFPCCLPDVLPWPLCLW